MSPALVSPPCDKKLATELFPSQQAVDDAPVASKLLSAIDYKNGENAHVAHKHYKKASKSYQYAFDAFNPSQADPILETAIQSNPALVYNKFLKFECAEHNCKVDLCL